MRSYLLQYLSLSQQSIAFSIFLKRNQQMNLQDHHKEAALLTINYNKGQKILTIGCFLKIDAPFLE